MENLRKKAEAQRESLGKRDEEAKRAYAKAVQKIFSTPEGLIFGRGLVYLLGVNRPTPMGKDYALNTMVDNVRREVYHNLIRPYLTANQKAKLEIGNE